MHQLPSSIDTLIIGAGAAGLGAARMLRDAGQECLIVEARSRVGGRAHTIHSGRAGALDLGCEWLHSADRNPLVAVARENGLGVDDDEPNWSTHQGKHFTRDEQAAFRAASTKFWDAAEAAAQAGQPDHPASHHLEPGNRWNGLIQAISSYYNGVELERVSIIDLDRYEDSGHNWKVSEGYGTLFDMLARDLPVVTDCIVRIIDHSARDIRVETSRGIINARHVIVTIPTPLIASGAMKFTPALPEKIAAAQGLPLGLANKIFFEIEGAHDLPADAHVFGRIDSADVISFDIQPRGRPLIAGFVGGPFAHHLERVGPAAFEAEARAQLAAMLGDLPTLRCVTTTAWHADPFAQGAYSHALPGQAEQRKALAAPVDERLFFAGEATSSRSFSTAHGAWESGRTAASEVLAQAKVTI